MNSVPLIQMYKVHTPEKRDQWAVYQIRTGVNKNGQAVYRSPERLGLFEFKDEAKRFYNLCNYNLKRAVYQR